MSNYSHSDPANNAIRKYRNHPGAKNISKTITLTSNFCFSGVHEADVETLIGNLNCFKAATLKNVPTKCLKVTFDICSLFLAAIRNQELILNKKLPEKLKLADKTPVYNKEDSTK